MKKSIFYYLFAVICTVGLFTSCSDDDDDDNGKAPTVSDIAGTYTGTLNVTVAGSETPIPNTPITLTKVSDSKVKVDLVNFSFSGITIDKISVECAVKENGKKMDVNGTSTVTVPIPVMGETPLPVVVDGDSDGTTLNLNIKITLANVLDVTVKYAGTK